MMTAMAAAEASEVTREAPVAPAYRLWIADNLAREARYPEVIRAFDSAIDSAQSARTTFLRASMPEGRHYSCRVSCGVSVVLVNEAAEAIMALDRARWLVSAAAPAVVAAAA